MLQLTFVSSQRKTHNLENQVDVACESKQRDSLDLVADSSFFLFFLSKFCLCGLCGESLFLAFSDVDLVSFLYAK